MLGESPTIRNPVPPRKAYQIGKAHQMGLGLISWSTSVPTYPLPPCNSHALVQATVGAGTVLIWYLILIRYQM